MHEASIAMSILDIAREHCVRAGYGRIQSIGVNIGSATGIFPDALSMAFDVAKSGTIASGAELIINHIPLGGTCRDCGNGFSADEQFILYCPKCGGKDFVLDAGREMDITEIEVD